MNNNESVTFLIYSDLYRYCGRFSTMLLIQQLLVGTGFKYTFWLRLSRYFRYKSKMYFPLFLFCWMMVRRYMFKFGIQIPYSAEIGPGFYIGHFGGINIGTTVRIGKNCNVSQGVTIGRSNRGKYIGSPIIGDNVYIAPGAKLFGGIKIGHNVAIGANAVVNRDIDDNSVVAGVPAKLISSLGSSGYINRTDY